MGTPPMATHEEVMALMKRLEQVCLLKPLHDLCREYHVTIQEVLSKARTKRVVTARAACCQRLLVTGFSHTEIGTMLGMNHSSVTDAIRRYRAKDNGSALR